MFATTSPSAKPEAMGVLPSPHRESSGERASAAGPAGRSKAGSFRRNAHQNAVSVKENGRYPPLDPPSHPSKSRLPAPPPLNGPPPKAPPPRAPHENDGDVGRRLQATSRKGSKSMSPGRSSTPPKRPPRPASELSLERPQDSPLILFSRRMRAAASGSAAPARPVLFDIDDLRSVPKQQSGVAKSMKPTSPTAARPPGRRKRRGETMSMLLDDGFFPIEELVYGESPPMTKAKHRYSSMAGFRINLPPRLSFIEMNSPMFLTSPPTPGTPGSPRNESGTPTAPRSARSRKHIVPGQSPLPQISESEDVASDEVAATTESDRTSPSKSPSKSEAATSKDERSPSPKTVAPVATQIQLRNGFIVTLTPPELAAWQPTLYLHGPIKLPKPTIMPRKNSVATLDPFQDAIEKLYQNTLTIPRRRSDDAVVDDICEYFDAFGFDLVSFAGDDFSDDDFGVGEVRDITLETETFSTPPTEPAMIAPVDAIVASDVLEESNSPQTPALQAPPVETEQTLCARGIARLSRSSAKSTGTTPDEGRPGRRESVTIGKPQTSAVLPLLPAPETSMLDAVLQPVQRNSYGASVYNQRHPDGGNAFAVRQDNASLRTTRTPSGGVRGDDRVEEMVSADSASLGKAKTKPVVATASKETKLSRVRRLVASASSIL